MIVKKYGNRRLYDTEESRYVRLGELAEKIRRGSDVQVVDATTGADLTAETLVQIIFDDRHAARLLPVSLLTRMIRMGDDALAEFLGRYVTWALEIYLQTKQGLNAFAPFSPFGGFMPFGPPASPASRAGTPAERPEPPPDIEERGRDIAELRRELEELKKSLKRRAR
jgi:polyhydroxyalkanoate synthesis repressor PhaR